MDLSEVIGFGIAGNFAGHLEQAGEAKDFDDFTPDKSKPAGLFPFYLPKSNLLNSYPYSSVEQNIPRNGNPQLEPEVAVLCELDYDEKGLVRCITPKLFTAFNDCTIRKDGAEKISEKKNWGQASKGISDNWLQIDSFDHQGILNKYSIASYVRRDGVVYSYGVKADISNYSLFNNELLDWLKDSMNNQTDFGPLENIKEIISNNDFPRKCIILLGSTAYEEFGENNFLQAGDVATVVLYQKDKHDPEQMLKSNTFPDDVCQVTQLVKY